MTDKNNATSTPATNNTGMFKHRRQGSTVTYTYTLFSCDTCKIQAIDELLKTLKNIDSVQCASFSHDYSDGCATPTKTHIHCAIHQPEARASSNVEGKISKHISEFELNLSTETEQIIGEDTTQLSHSL